MTSSLEFEDKNVDKAVEKACEELSMPKEELKYEVLSYGSSGIFGISGTKMARIRVQIPEDVLASDSEPNNLDLESNSPSGLDLDREFSAANESNNAAQLYTFPENPLDLGRSVLQQIIDCITSDAKIFVKEDSNRILFNVVAANAAILIGKHGQTLEAIQSIVERVVNKHNEKRIRVLVDIEGYLETRRTNLEQLAARLADKSKRIGKPISLGQMNAYDRRIVHLALKDDPDVKTQSRGVGSFRKLVIFPKRRNFLRNQRSY